MKRQAVLVFAHPIGLDLARRHLPRMLRPLLSLRRLQGSGAAVDFHLFTTGRSLRVPGFECHEQTGATFAERLESATAKIARLGYEEIVLVGSDCPALTAGDIENAFRQLTDRRLVLGPDHRGGCYLIALRTTDRDLIAGIKWNRDRDRAELMSRVEAHEASLLSVKQDVDTWADLRLLGQAGHALVRALLDLLAAVPVAKHLFVDLSAQRIRVRGQIPPPVFAA